MKQQDTAKWEYVICVLYFALYITISLSLLFKQPFGNPPDEYNRYLIPQYIAEHGTLPGGFDESIRIHGYGFSYAFQPILPYMVQGYVMRVVRSFTRDAGILLYSARLVDFAFGLIMSVFVQLLGKKWFRDKRLKYLFAFLVTFLPQSIFLHTYVNTDSCCMMSIAIMLYGLTLCLEDGFAYRSCVCLSVGIIICALSYYNAYGYILSCILLFIAHFLSRENRENGRLRLDWKPFLKKGIFISALVLLGISWWFIRSFLLYDGDFLGLRTRDYCALLYASPELKPGQRYTFARLGLPLWKFFYYSDFLVLTTNSFICTYGPMELITSLWVYRFYKLLFVVGLPLCILLSGRLRRKIGMDAGLWQDRPTFRIFFHLNMVFCILMPCILSIYYSFHTDYQPQGRYIMPILIPLCYYCVRGFEKGWRMLTALVNPILGRAVLDKAALEEAAFIESVPVENKDKNRPAGSIRMDRLLTGLIVLLILLITLSLIITVYGYAFPYFASLK